MARYTGPATRVSRRLRVDLVGGDMAFERRPYIDWLSPATIVDEMDDDDDDDRQDPEGETEA